MKLISQLKQKAAASTAKQAQLASASLVRSKNSTANFACLLNKKAT